MESVVAMFEKPQQAEEAIRALLQRGFDRDRLGFAMTDATAQANLAQRTGISAEEGAPAGAGGVIKGALLGTAAGLILTIPIWLLLSWIELPAEFVNGGGFAALFGVIGGLTLGGLFGALSGSDHGDYVRLLRGFGIPAKEAEYIYRQIQNGNVMVIARDADEAQADVASRLMRQLGALDMNAATTQGNQPVSDVELYSENRGYQETGNANFDNSTPDSSGIPNAQYYEQNYEQTQR